MYICKRLSMPEKSQIPVFNTLQAKGTNEFNTLRCNFTLKKPAYGNLHSVHACQIMAHI